MVWISCNSAHMDWFTCQMWKKYSNVEKGSGPEQIFILCVWLLSGFFFRVTGLLRVLTTCWESFFLGLSPGSIARERVVFISFLSSANPESWALLHSHLQQAALQDVCHGTHTAMAQQAVPGTELKKSRRSLALDASDLFWEDKNN